jgi:hypothetical protein
MFIVGKKIPESCPDEQKPEGRNPKTEKNPKFDPSFSGARPSGCFNVYVRDALKRAKARAPKGTGFHLLPLMLSPYFGFRPSTFGFIRHHARIHNKRGKTNWHLL